MGNQFVVWNTFFFQFFYVPFYLITDWNGGIFFVKLVFLKRPGVHAEQGSSK